ncbi:MAG TPA: biopolymer transporter ExbD [Verrucomicrobiae bacterium]|jgi:biopolymer transport protein ExbD|nr:biopolymer transporter ExbD [Verrucomicrobiae bacterium]
MKLQQTSVRRRARIEIIPLIDIIFFLLATFVMVSLSMIKNDGISVKLPKAATATAQERDLSATITVKENGELYLNKEKITAENLLGRLTEMKAKEPETRVFVNGDELSYFGDVVTVLDKIRQAGIDKIGIQTQGVKNAPAAQVPAPPDAVTEVP